MLFCTNSPFVAGFVVCFRVDPEVVAGFVVCFRVEPEVVAASCSCRSFTRTWAFRSFTRTCLVSSFSASAKTERHFETEHVCDDPRDREIVVVSTSLDW